MEKTALQKLINQLETELKKCSLGGVQYYGLIQAQRMAKELIAEERKQIESAYNCGKSQLEAIGDKYYFMTYIDND